MPGRTSGTFSNGYARIENVRRSKSPVARVARQLAYSPLVAISLTSTVIRRSASAGIRTAKRAPTLRAVTRASRRSKWTHRSLRSISVTSGTPGETYSPGPTVRLETCEAHRRVDDHLVDNRLHRRDVGNRLLHLCRGDLAFLFRVAVDRLLVGGFGLVHGAFAFVQGVGRLVE